MRRRHVHETRATIARQVPRVQTVLIDCGGQEPDSGGLEAIARDEIPRVLEKSGIAGIKQQACAQIDGLLRALTTRICWGSQTSPRKAHSPRIADTRRSPLVSVFLCDHRLSQPVESQGEAPGYNFCALIGYDKLSSSVITTSPSHVQQSRVERLAHRAPMCFYQAGSRLWTL